MQEAFDNILGSTGSGEKDIGILPSAQGDACATDVKEDDIDESHKMICFQTMLHEL